MKIPSSCCAIGCTKRFTKWPAHMRCIMYTFQWCRTHGCAGCWRTPRYVLVAMFNYLIPYSAKFSRRIMFACFAVGIEPRKLSSAKFKNTVLMLTESLNPVNYFRKISENANPRKLCASKIWRNNLYARTCMHVILVHPY